MKTVEQEIITLRKRAKSWLASLTYYSARGKINPGLYCDRLHSLLKPLFKSEILQEALSDAIPEAKDTQDPLNIKKSIISRLTPNKFYGRMLSYPRIPAGKTQVKEQPHSVTPGILIVTWAVFTNQPLQDFIERIFPKISRLYIEWLDSTHRGVPGKANQDNDKKSARFWSGICRTMIQATPEENLTNFMQTKIKALGTVIGMPDMEKEMYTLLGQASHFMTKDKARKIKSALNANPNARKSMNIPELKALVQREEARLGWSNTTAKAAIKTIESSLSPEVKEAIEDNEEVIGSSIEEISRRGLFNNLLDALNGQLRPRFVESITRFLKSIVHVKSNWEFDTSDSAQENFNSIRRWLFRR